MASDLVPACQRTVVLTGASGFVGKVVLFELLRRRAELGIARIFVLLRGRGSSGPAARFDAEIVQSAALSSLPGPWRDLCVPIACELSHPDAGIAPGDRTRISAEATHIIHCAAAIEFDLPVATAAAANATAALNVLHLARGCRALGRMVSVSTAYVAPHPGDEQIIEPTLVPLPQPARAIYDAILAGQADERDLLAQTGHPNTYTFTKCLAEHLLVQNAGAVPLSIVRPSIVSASWRLPFPGWIDSAAAFAGYVRLLGGGLLRNIDARPDARLDVVPVDLVAQRIVDETFATPAEESTPSTPRIVFAVSGPTGSATIDESVTTIRAFFGRFFERTQRAVSYRARSHGARQLLGRALAAIVAPGIRWAGGRKHRARTRLAARMTQSVRGLSYFAHRTFRFNSTPPPGFDAGNYLQVVCAGVHVHLMNGRPEEQSLAGLRHRERGSDLGFALSRRNSSLTFRATAIGLRRVLRACAELVTVDYPSFERAVSTLSGDVLPVIVPTHRSYMDFLLCSYLFYAHPELGIAMPRIAAADDFSRIPVLGRILKLGGAFYIRRGVGRANADLARRIAELVERKETLQFFIEGQRSRSRQFLPPRRGMLRALKSTGQVCALLPVAITYDRRSDEISLLEEVRGRGKVGMGLHILAGWMRRLRAGKIRLGRVHMACGAPVLMGPQDDVHTVAARVMGELQGATAVTTHHLRSFLFHAQPAGVDLTWLRAALQRRGATVLDGGIDPEEADPIAERSMRHDFIHHFFPDARGRWPAHPAIDHFLSVNDYRGRDAADPGDRDDPRLAAVLDALFAPICRDFHAVVTTVQALTTQAAPAPAVTPGGIARGIDGGYLPVIESALEALVARRILVRQDAATGYVLGPQVALLDDLAPANNQGDLRGDLQGDLQKDPRQQRGSVAQR